MAIGRRNDVTTVGGSFEVAGAVALSAIRKGAAVGIISDPSGPSIVEVSSSSNGRKFLGFSSGAYSAGETVRVFTVRGSTISPIVKGGASLTVGSRVFLSDVQGEVSETPPVGSGIVILQVGVSSNVDKIIINTDFRVNKP